MATLSGETAWVVVVLWKKEGGTWSDPPGSEAFLVGAESIEAVALNRVSNPISIACYEV